MKRHHRSNPSAAAVAPWAVLGSGAAALGWAAIRFSERAKLAEQLGNTVRIQTLKKEYEAAGAAPPEFAWIKDGAWEARAAEALPLFSMVSADAAFGQIKASLPKIASPQAGLTLDSIRDQLKSLGLDLPASVDDALDVIDSATRKFGGTASGASGAKPRPS